MIKAVIFDMDGLLIDSEIVTFNLYKEICLKHGKVLEQDFYFSLLGTNATYIQSELGQYLGDGSLAKEVIKKVHQSLDTYFEDHGVPVKRGAESLISFLKAEEIKLAVATSSSRERALKLLLKCGLLNSFDAVVCGDEVENSKPHPEIFLKAAEAVGIEPADVIILEDSENGILGARTGGMRCINVPDLKKPSDLIISMADLIATDLLEVADYIKKTLMKD